MKRLCKNFGFKSLFLLGLFGIAVPGFCQSALVLVGAVVGNVFYSYQGKTHPLRSHQQLKAGSDLFVELGSQVSFVDFHDRQYHLASGGQIAIDEGKIRLVRGVLWIQSLRQDKSFRVVTANSEVQFRGGEGIFSFDNALGKSQLLVLRGAFTLAHLQNSDHYVTVQDGEFSFVTDQQVDGFPRTPTSVGPRSFGKVLQLFSNVVPLAGSQQLVAITEVKNEIKQENIQRTPASGPDNLQQMIYQEKLAQLAALPTPQQRPKRRVSKSAARIIIFSHVQPPLPPTTSPSKKTQQRTPASIGPSVPASDFEASLLEQQKKQMRHSTEVNQLIDQLQSYKQDYQKGY